MYQFINDRRNQGFESESKLKWKGEMSEAYVSCSGGNVQDYTKMDPNFELSVVRGQRASDVMEHIKEYGPTIVHINVYPVLLSYEGGILERFNKGPKAGITAGVLIGYSSAESYLILKMSWGAEFGSTGHVRIESRDFIDNYLVPIDMYADKYPAHMIVTSRDMIDSLFHKLNDDMVSKFDDNMIQTAKDAVNKGIDIRRGKSMHVLQHP